MPPQSRALNLTSREKKKRKRKKRFHGSAVIFESRRRRKSARRADTSKSGTAESGSHQARYISKKLLLRYRSEHDEWINVLLHVCRMFDVELFRARARYTRLGRELVQDDIFRVVLCDANRRMAVKG